MRVKVKLKLFRSEPRVGIVGHILKTQNINYCGQVCGIFACGN